MALYNLLMMPNLDTYHFLPYSNPTTSGGYGPNQVSTIFGVAIAIIISSQIIKLDLFGSKFMHIMLLMVLLALGFITFSRVGILASILALTFSISYYLFHGQRKVQILSITFLILGCILVTVLSRSFCSLVK